MNKNILELCLAHGLGGLEMFVASCYKNFSTKTTCKVAVVKDSKLDNYLDGIEKLYIKRNRLFPIFPALKLAKYIDANEIDIVHFHWTRDIITAVLAKILSKRKPKLVQSRHMRMTRFKEDFYHKWLYKNIDIIHAVTEQVKEQLQKFIPQDIRPKVEMVHLGIEAHVVKKETIEFLSKKYNLKDAFIIGIIGRIEEEKNQHIVIETVSRLKIKNFKLFIVGDSMDDNYLNKLHEICKKNKIEDRVIFTGFTKETDAYMQLCDITILATKNETFGLVIIESMANETPVIVTDRGGPLEIIDDGVDGLLYDGSSNDLATKIELLYNDRDLTTKLARNSLKKVHDKFNFDKQLDKLYEVIIRDENEVKF